MRKYLSFCLLLALTYTNCYADKKPEKLEPLHKETRHFIHYRVLCMQGNLCSIHTLIEQMKENPKHYKEYVDAISKEIAEIEYQMGM